MMGFITCLNDILVPYLKEVFDLDYTQASLVQFCFFAAYGLMSIPASHLLEKIGYQKSMVLSLIITAVGCVLFFPAVSFHKYSLFLLALFVLATGIVILQVAANPFVSVLGTPETSSSRLTMVQAFNSFGTFLAPFFGSYFILRSLSQTTDASAVRYPYLWIALVLIVIALILSRIKLPEIKVPDSHNGSWKTVLYNKSLILSMLGIFAYVGAEVSIGSFLVNYIMEMQGTSETEAATMVSIYWGAAMAGRFIGIFTLKEFAPSRVLSFHGVLAVSLILISINSRGLMSVYSMILVGFCNSIMFPTIFTLGIKDMNANDAQKGSGLLATAILGGAILPVLTGKLADIGGLRLAFLLPVFCYVYITFLGLASPKTRELATENAH